MSREGLSEWEKKFDYVNGGLFEEESPIPIFSVKAFRYLKDGIGLNWAEINPDIFRSMIQVIAHSQKCAELGMHYMTRLNILKLLEPLFL